MGTISTVLIILGSISLFIIVVSWGVFSFKKKKEKQDDTPVMEAPEPEPVKQDDEFKVTKVGRFSRVSKKALESDSRTATIERVYEKTPEKEPTDQFINPMSLSQESEELLDSINQLEKDDAKVVSIGELQKSVDEAEKVEPVVVPETQPKTKETKFRYSYGLTAAQSQTEQQSPSDSQTMNDEMESIKNRIFGGSAPNSFNNFDLPPRFRNSGSMPNATPKTEEYNYNDMIESEVILNPKFKNKKNKK